MTTIGNGRKKSRSQVERVQ